MQNDGAPTSNAKAGFLLESLSTNVKELEDLFAGRKQARPKQRRGSFSRFAVEDEEELSPQQPEQAEEKLPRNLTLLEEILVNVESLETLNPHSGQRSPSGIAESLLENNFFFFVTALCLHVQEAWSRRSLDPHR